MKHAHTISWITFALLGAITLVPSLLSLNFAYFNPSGDMIAGRFTPAEVANGDEEVAAALSARRGTAAAFGVSYAVLLLGVALGPYRKRTNVRHAWALLVTATLANALLILLRVPTLGVHYGLAAANVPLVLVVIAAGFGAIGLRQK